MISTLYLTFHLISNCSLVFVALSDPSPSRRGMHRRIWHMKETELLWIALGLDFTSSISAMRYFDLLIIPLAYSSNSRSLFCLYHKAWHVCKLLLMFPLSDDNIHRRFYGTRNISIPWNLQSLCRRCYHEGTAGTVVDHLLLLRFVWLSLSWWLRYCHNLRAAKKRFRQVYCQMTTGACSIHFPLCCPQWR